MASDFNKPLVTDTYSTLVPALQTAHIDIMRWLEPTLTGTHTNVPTGAIRINAATNTIERYNGTVWSALTFTVGSGTASTGVFSSIVGGTTVTATTSMSAPKFYDSDNTVYYTDPAGVSNLSGLTVASTITGSVSGSAATVTAAAQPNITSHGTLTALNVSGQTTLNGGTLLPLTVTTSSAGPWGISLSRSDLGLISQVYNDNGSRWYFQHLPSFAGATPLTSSNYSTYALPISGGTMTGGFTAKTISWTGNGTDSGNSFTANHYSMGQASGAWTNPYPDLIIGYHTGIRIGGHYNYGGTRFYNNSPTSDGTAAELELFSVGNTDNNVRVAYNLYAPIMYDINNTGYYVDPASVSVFSDTRVCSGNTQLITANVGQNTKWRALSGSTDVGIALYDAGDNFRMQLYAASGGAYGFLNGLWGGWDIQKNISGNLFLNGNNSYYLNPGSDNYLYRVYGAADTRSPIFYDLDNTGYYVDPNGTTNLYVVNMQSTVTTNSTFNCNAASYFLGNMNTATGTSPAMMVYSTGANGAMMSFHRGGYYAVNMGLDSDNVIRIGGWSAGVNRWQLDMSGNMYAAGNVTAYSSDRRLKKNITTITNAISKVKQLRGVYFDWEDFVSELGFNPIDKHDIGVIAQEFKEVIPQGIKPAPFDTGLNGESQSGKNYLTVQMEKAIPLLIEAIKEQQAMIEALMEKVYA